jgi:hypothetical protein
VRAVILRYPVATRRPRRLVRCRPPWWVLVLSALQYSHLRFRCKEGGKTDDLEILHNSLVLLKAWNNVVNRTDNIEPFRTSFGQQKSCAYLITPNASLNSTYKLIVSHIIAWVTVPPKRCSHPIPFRILFWIRHPEQDLLLCSCNHVVSRVVSYNSSRPLRR